MSQKRDLVAPCGIDCFNCEFYQDNITEKWQQMLATRLNLEPALVGCKGCREQPGCLVHEGCKTLKCVNEKGFEFCHECAEFPCPKYQPAADGADKYPHNLKVYNLCRIKLLGVEKWIEKEPEETRKRYYRGKFVIGSGPQCE